MSPAENLHTEHVQNMSKMLSLVDNGYYDQPICQSIKTDLYIDVSREQKRAASCSDFYYASWWWGEEFPIVSYVTSHPDYMYIIVKKNLTV